MAFDGNGNWVSNYSAVAQRDADLPILASNFDNILLADLATSFENCLTKDGQVKPQQAFDANSYKVINVATPTNNNDAANKQYVDSKASSSSSSAINTLLSALYPVGSLYITTNNAATCPLASLIAGSSWSLVAADKALWTSNRNGNTTIAAGLPNITGYIGSDDHLITRIGGAFANTANESGSTHHLETSSGSKDYDITFNASKSNSIYGKSSTVQPPAYRVNVWRRTA